MRMGEEILPAHKGRRRTGSEESCAAPNRLPLTVALADRHQPTKEDHHETTSS
jgi:hypothetical protein